MWGAEKRTGGLPYRGLFYRHGSQVVSPLALAPPPPPAMSFIRVPPLLWGSAFFVGCLAVLGSSLPHNTHVPPPDNGQGPAAEAESPSGDWPSQRGYPGPL